VCTGGAAPGTIHVWVDVPGPTRCSSSTGSHALGLADAVALGIALDQLPARLIIVGIEASWTTPGHGLSSAVADAVERVVDLITESAPFGPKTQRRPESAARPIGSHTRNRGV
jgi:hydrogenase maturation protease